MIRFLRLVCNVQEFNFPSSGFLFFPAKQLVSVWLPPHFQMNHICYSKQEAETFQRPKRVLLNLCSQRTHLWPFDWEETSDLITWESGLCFVNFNMFHWWEERLVFFCLESCKEWPQMCNIDYAFFSLERLSSFFWWLENRSRVYSKIANEIIA